MVRRRIARHLPGAVRRAPERLRQLTWRDIGLMVLSPIALPLTALALRRYGLTHVQEVLSSRAPRRAVARPGGEPSDEAERLAWIVRVASGYGPWPANCLQRSVVLWWYLRRRGLDGELRIGVRRDKAADALDFHAWVEYAGVVLNDTPDVRERYATFDRPIAPRTATFR